PFVSRRLVLVTLVADALQVRQVVRSALRLGRDVVNGPRLGDATCHHAWLAQVAVALEGLQPDAVPSCPIPTLMPAALVSPWLAGHFDRIPSTTRHAAGKKHPSG